MLGGKPIMSTGPNAIADAQNEPFDHALARVLSAGQQFVEGDATAIKECWSHEADVSIFGAGGGQPCGWDEVRPSLEGGARLFRKGHVRGQLEVDVMAKGTSGDLAYTVGIERGRASMQGQDEPRPVLLRVTQIYRREVGMWKIVHRHADTLTT